MNVLNLLKESLIYTVANGHMSKKIQSFIHVQREEKKTGEHSHYNELFI